LLKFAYGHLKSEETSGITWMCLKPRMILDWTALGIVLRSPTEQIVVIESQLQSTSESLIVILG